MKNSEIPKITNDKGKKTIKIKFKEFNCLGAKPPHDHPHIFLNLGRKKEISAAFRGNIPSIIFECGHDTAVSVVRCAD